jgi:hypothetical protein
LLLICCGLEIINFEGFFEKGNTLPVPFRFSIIMTQDRVGGMDGGQQVRQLGAVPRINRVQQVFPITLMI